uniref:Protein translation factor SUI1 homolog n=1 Tax=Leersia perrieri TaxID=77586 RepID=A0A0D9W9V7_9ORYZ
MQKTNANKTNPPAISTSKIPKSAAVSPPSSPSPSKLATTTTKLPPPQASSLWAASSSDDDSDTEATAITAPPPPPASKKTTTKKYTKNRLPSKNKYLLSMNLGIDDPLMSSDPSAAATELSLPGAYDPFADAQGEDGGVGGGGGGDYVHLRVQQRNGRKTLTSVQGLGGEYNYGKVLRDLKRELCCNGTVVEDQELGKIIQLQGDHRGRVAAFLAKSGMVHEDNIKVHGF